MANKNNNEGPAFRGRNAAGAPPKKPKNFKSTIKKLMQYLKVYRTGMIISFILAVLSVSFSVIAPKISGMAVTEIGNGIAVPGRSIDFDIISKYCIIMLVLYLFSNTAMYIQGLIMASVSQKVSYNLRSEISKKINRLPMNYFDQNSQGDVLSRITNDVDTLSNSLNQSLSQMITSITKVIGILAMMLYISVSMTVVALLILPLSITCIRFVVKKSQNNFKDQQKILGQINGQIEEVYAGHSVVKIFNGTEREMEEFEKRNKNLYKVGIRAQFFSGVMMPVMAAIGNLGYVGVSVLGGYLASRGVIEIGDITSFLQYVRDFNNPITQMAQISTVLQSTVAASERVFEFLDEEEEVPETENVTDVSNLEGSVEFEHVNFGYDPENTIINDFSVKVEEGEKVAIVGPTGAGKTTIVKLLMRFYEVDSGAILVGDHEIDELKRSELRSMFGMVLQDTWLFKGTILDNLKFGKPDATYEEVVQAAKDAHAHHFIKSLPGGYNMEINEEASNISSGQKQLLTIARAFLTDPKILILDEATSSVDTRTEVIIQKAMNNLMKGRTSFIIAHRLSTIKDADTILVMDKGDILEVGSHEKLIEEKGFYYNLYNSQFDNVVE